MKHLIFILFSVASLYSCKKPNESIELSCEKIYIVECNWTYPDDHCQIGFNVVGFSELDKSFNLKFAYRSTHHQYDTSNSSIADSLKNKIVRIIDSYPMDTTLFHSYEGDYRLYDGNSYLFIFQKNENELTRIYFEPKFLPQDLLFLYNCLYENKQKQVGKSQYEGLFSKFENIIKKDVPPPPILKETIRFTPPVINKKKRN